MSRLTTITYPDSTTSTFAYDSRGRRTSVTDQNSKTTTYAYDDEDRLTSVTDAANNATTYGGWPGLVVELWVPCPSSFEGRGF